MHCSSRSGRALLGVVGLVALGGMLLLTGAGAPATAQPDPRYYDYDEVLALFDAWTADYPDIFHREVIGYSLLGEEPIWACKISDNAALHEAEARVMIDAAIHANEANGVGAIVYMIDKLLTRYGSSPEYTAMVDNLEMWFVPVINVDGYRMVFAGGADWDLWRKTKRDNDGNELYTYPEDGVDANRNWDYRWYEYDQTDYRSTRYKGPYAWSEPEVVAMRDLIMRELPVFLMDLHSPDVPSIGNKIWWPWYDPDHGTYGPDDDIYQPISQTLGSRCMTETGGTVNGSGACYNRLPKEQCWVYSNTGICAFLMEISLQYWWSGATVDTIAARTGRGLFYLMERAQSGPGLTGIVTSAGSGSPLQAEIVVSQVHSSVIGPRTSEQFHGQYWRLLNSGNYTVTASAPGHEPDTQSIYVSSSGWTELDFQLEPESGSSVGSDPLAAGQRIWNDSPLRPGGAIHLRLPEEGRVTLELVDVTGRQARTLLDGLLPAGVRSISLERGLPAGAYMMLLRTDRERIARKVMLVD